MIAHFSRIILYCAVVATCAFAGTVANYSGSYSSESKKGKEGTTDRVVLRVTQTDSAIEVTRTDQSKTVTNRFLLDGTYADYIDATGEPVRTRVEFKDNYLVLESAVVSLRNGGRSTLRVYTIEKWQLSPDGRTLTIHTEISFPGMSLEVTDLAVPNRSWTETFQRTDSP